MAFWVLPDASEVARKKGVWGWKYKESTINTSSVFLPDLILPQPEGRSVPGASPHSACGPWTSSTHVPNFRAISRPTDVSEGLGKSREGSGCNHSPGALSSQTQGEGNTFTRQRRFAIGVPGTPYKPCSLLLSRFTQLL